MIPVLVELPLPFGLKSLPLYSFGLMVVFCFVTAWRRLFISLEEAGENPALAERMVTWAAVGGVIGAKLGYLVSFPEDFYSDPLGSVFSGSGFVFYEGFIGGALAVWVLLRREKLGFLFMADITAPALAVGYAVGRVGCQLSGDGDYGVESTLPWAMSYLNGVVPTPPGVLVHPTPLYETLLSLGIALLLITRPVISKFQGHGQRFGLYLILSSLARACVEIIRIEPRVWSVFTQAQLIAGVLSVVGFCLLIRPTVCKKA